MNWTADGTGINDTETGRDERIDSSARAACEHGRRLANQSERQTEHARTWAEQSLAGVTGFALGIKAVGARVEQ